MNLSQHIKNEKTPAQRIKNATKKQAQDINKIKNAITYKLNDIVKTNGLKDLNDITYKVSGRAGKTEDFRIKTFIIPVDENWVNEILISNSIKNTTVKFLSSSEAKVFSSKFNTIKITSENDANIFIVLSGKGKTGEKQLTPNKFDIEGQDYTYNDIYIKVINKLENIIIDKDIKEYLVFLLKAATFGKIIKISNGISIKIDNFTNHIEKSDKLKIHKDFGEVFGAITISRYHGNNEMINFPSSASEPLVDYKVGNIRYSAKSISGAAPTLTSIAKKYLNFVENEMEGSIQEKTHLINIFKYLLDKKNMDTSQTTLAICKATNPEMWQIFLDFMEETNLQPNQKSIKTKIENKLDNYFENNILEDKLNTFYNKIENNAGYVRAGKRLPISEFNVHASWRRGFITSPMGYAIAKWLNKKDDKIRNQLKTVINQLDDVRQINLFVNSNSIDFIITEFIDDNLKIRFEGGGQIKVPNQQKIRFKIIV